MPFGHQPCRDQHERKGGHQLVGPAEEHPEVLPPAGEHEDDAEDAGDEGPDVGVSEDRADVAQELGRGHPHETDDELHDRHGQNDHHDAAVGAARVQPASPMAPRNLETPAAKMTPGPFGRRGAVFSRGGIDGPGNDQCEHGQHHLHEHDPAADRAGIQLTLELPGGAGARHDAVPAGDGPAGDGDEHDRPDGSDPDVEAGVGGQREVGMEDKEHR